MSQQDGLTGAVDVLSPLARNLLKLDSATAYQRLVVEGDGNAEAKAVLEMLKPDQLLAVPIRRTEPARALLSGIWLWHDWLEESHVISQSLNSPTGSFWHAIMHRREGDFSNSKYWYARTGRHEIYAALGAHAAVAINPLPADKPLLRLLRDTWDPEAFVDLVQHVSTRPEDPRLRAVQELQRIEWQLLFEHCAREATG